eukprot:748197-Hanusia_phi.AAC.1
MYGSVSHKNSGKCGGRGGPLGKPWVSPNRGGFYSKRGGTLEVKLRGLREAAGRQGVGSSNGTEGDEGLA